MTRITQAFALAAALAAASPAHAAIEDQYEQDTPGPAMTTWYVSAEPAALQADRDYVAGMRPHHAGALTMSRDYLADPASSSPVLRVLAQAIIRNQTFEVALLDEVARNLAQPSTTLDLGLFRLAWRPAATEGLAQRTRFFRSPIPTRLDAVSDPGKPVTARDVQFAKAMTIHHQGAVDMAREYHANPAARNGFLGLMNIDIERDQEQEIGLMQKVVAQYRGNPDAVKVDASMIHGMDGMGHGGHAGHDAVMPVAAPAAPVAGPQAPAAVLRGPARARVPVARQPAAPSAPTGHTGHEGHHN